MSARHENETVMRAQRDEGKEKLMTADTPKTPSGASLEKVSAGALRSLMEAFANFHILHEGDTERQAAARKLAEVREMIEHHVSDAEWRAHLLHAHEAARRGAHEVMLLRVPGTECTDGGRAISAGDADWPQTLRGAAADLYRVWKDDLHERGFHLTARMLNHPHGGFGDVGFFLSWEERR